MTEEQTSIRFKPYFRLPNTTEHIEKQMKESGDYSDKTTFDDIAEYASKHVEVTIKDL